MDSIFAQIICIGKWVVLVVAFAIVAWVFREAYLASKDERANGELLKFDPYELMKHASESPSSKNAYIIYSGAKDMVLMCTSEGMTFVTKDMQRFAWHMSEETADKVVSILNECGYEDLQLQVCNNLVTRCKHKRVSII
nr:MAG TPA: hypothetical protein [Caudoviricetes sp.]